MGNADLEEIARELFDDPGVLGRIACYLYDDDSTVQLHHDKRRFTVFWRERLPGEWRCTIFLEDSDDALAQIDMHSDGTLRVEAWEPLSVTVRPADNVLCLTRFRNL